MIITLENYEIEAAAIVGMKRNLGQGQKGGKLGNETTNKVKNKDFGWHIDIESTAAEMAFAKAFNLYWSFSVNTFKSLPDVDRYEIRHTQKDDGSLIVRPADKKKYDEKTVFFLVTGTSPIFTIRGWMQMRDICVDDFIFKGYNGMPDAWFVPQKDLHKNLKWVSHI